jgi:hypothetical protein
MVGCLVTSECFAVAIVDLAAPGILDHPTELWVSGVVTDPPENCKVTIQVVNVYVKNGIQITSAAIYQSVPVASDGSFIAPDSFGFHGPGNYTIHAVIDGMNTSDTELGQVCAPGPG